MYKKVLLLPLILFATSGLVSQSHAQMMQQRYASPTTSPSQFQQQQQEESEGKGLFDQLQNQQTTCEKLTDSDFEKIGEYTMSQMLGNNTPAHVSMNERIKQMHGETGEEQMHVQIGKSVTDCPTGSLQTSTSKGGVSPLMSWYSGYGMMNGTFGEGVSFLWGGIILHTLICIDLILLGVWLWKQIRKK